MRSTRLEGSPVIVAWRRLSVTQRLMLRGVGVFAVAVFLAGAVGGWSKRAIASEDWASPAGTSSLWSQWRFLRESLDSVSGELELTRIQLERSEAIVEHSTRFQVPADLTSMIYDAAIAAGLEPELGFRLVKVESRFNPRATSPMGAVGLAQVQLPTARHYYQEITLEELYQPAVNLEIGFRYLRHLIDRYGDLRLALLAYNRGPRRVADLMDHGQDPRNGYASSVMDGYNVGM